MLMTKFLSLVQTSALSSRLRNLLSNSSCIFPFAFLVLLLVVVDGGPDQSLIDFQLIGLVLPSILPGSWAEHLLNQSHSSKTQSPFCLLLLVATPLSFTRYHSANNFLESVELSRPLMVSSEFSSWLWIY